MIEPLSNSVATVPTEDYEDVLCEFGLEVLRTAIYDGEASGLAADGVFDRVRGKKA